MTRNVVILTGIAIALLAGCDDSVRTVAGGEQIDALHRVRSAAEQAEAHSETRFKKALPDDNRQRALDEATGD